MWEPLATAIAAARNSDWTAVSLSLQQLPLDNKGQAPAALNGEERQQVIDLSFQVLREGDFQQKWEIAKLFPKLGQEAIPPLLELLADKGEDIESRWFAARLASQFAHPDCTIALVKLLQPTVEEELSAIASQSLAQIGRPAIASLSRLLDKQESRLLAVRSLAQIRRPETIAPLLQVTADSSPEIRALAIEALGSFHDSSLLPVLLAALKDPAATVRQEAAAALGRYNGGLSHADLVAAIKPLLSDFNRTVCRQAALALGRLGSNEAAGALFPAFKSPATPIWLKRDLVMALGWIETLERLNYLQEGLRWSDPSICAEIIAVLGRQKSSALKSRATQILIEFLHSGQQAASQPEVKQALALSLGELGEIEALESLEHLACDPERRVRLHALAALQKIPRQEFQP